MQIAQQVDLRAIAPVDLPRVSEFLHEHMNERLSAAEWLAGLTPSWQVDPPNHGFMLAQDDRIVGAYLALYSDRLIDGELERFCNLAAWCVLEEHRAQGLRLVRAILRQKGVHFTDLSPSGNVVELNKRLGFTSLDTTTTLTPNLPLPGPRHTRITSDPEAITGILDGPDLKIYQDHRASPAARHIVVQRAGSYCYLIFRRDRRKGLPLFASILYVSDVNQFAVVARAVHRHLLLRHRILATLAEVRVAGNGTPVSITLKKSRPKMFRSDRLQPEQIDYLYSELASLAW